MSPMVTRHPLAMWMGLALRFARPCCEREESASACCWRHLRTPTGGVETVVAMGAPRVERVECKINNK